MPIRLETWFAVGSAYTWLAIRRAEMLEAAGEVVFDWKPYSTRIVMSELGTLPKNAPVKLAYIWRDIERRAPRLGLSPRFPAPYPLVDYDRANHVAVLAAREGWCFDYLRATYRRWMQEGQVAGAEPNLSESLREIGRDPVETLARADAPEIAAAFLANTDRARELGVFGAPTFRVGEELFWGEDRLDDALDWARTGRLSAP
ncbi:MAG: DsbA family protein [Pseudomonadota bacterium]|nr:DsbA family protein [Pseudomonadota bacterium]MEE3101046.1 DsbA family protein [Pseudomonadota bacterium]